MIYIYRISLNIYTSQYLTIYRQYLEYLTLIVTRLALCLTKSRYRSINSGYLIGVYRKHR